MTNRKKTEILAVLAISLTVAWISHAANISTPYTIKQVEDPRDASAINTNFIAVIDSVRSFDQRTHTWTSDQIFRGDATFENIDIDGTLNVDSDSTLQDVTVQDLTVDGTPTNIAFPVVIGVSVTSDAANTMIYSVNVTSVTQTATGVFTVTLSTPFVHDGYLVNVTSSHASLYFCGVGISNGAKKSVRHFGVRCENNAGATKTPHQLMFTAYGVLDP